MEIPAAVGRVLQKLEPNTRVSIRSAERQARDEIREADSAPVRCAFARVMVEDWRNGWDEFAEDRNRGAALDRALDALDMASKRRSREHWYVDWKRGYVLRYTARAFNRPDHAEAALQAYRNAYETLSGYCGLPPRRGEKALRSLLVDWAETLVYFGDVPAALQNFEFTVPWHRRVPDDWHEWAHAFALHQNGDYEASWRKMEPLVDLLDNPRAEHETQRAQTLIAPRANRKVHPSYYNDMRLVLAASYARDRQREKARRQIEKFQQLRRLSGDQPWTIAMEAERGAFVAGSAAETHWLGSLSEAGLPDGERSAERLVYAGPSHAGTAQKASRSPAKAAPRARASKKKPGTKAKSDATRKSGTKKKPGAKKKPAGRRKTAAKARPKKAGAGRKSKPTSKRATKRARKQAAKRKPVRKSARRQAATSRSRRRSAGRGPQRRR